jgi:hypothetical protein
MSPWVLHTLLFVGAWVGFAALSTGSIAAASLRRDQAKVKARQTDRGS